MMFTCISSPCTCTHFYHQNVIAGRVLRVTIPYIKKDIPVMIVFRALGFIRDRDILEHIVYNFNDKAMMELMQPSLEEAFVIHDQQVALDYIGKRGTTVGQNREKRIAYATSILQKEFMPHISTEENGEVKKVRVRSLLACFIVFIIVLVIISSCSSSQSCLSLCSPSHINLIIIIIIIMPISSFT